MDKNRSKDFRRVYINAFGVRVGDNDVTLTLGMHEGGDPKDMLEEVAVVMTPRMLKIIVNNLDNALKVLESSFGEISVPSGKLIASHDEMIKAGKITVETTEVAAVKKPKNKKPKISLKPAP